MLRTQLSVLALCAFTLLACTEDAQKIKPDTEGGRGESCTARNDCAKGLACIPGPGGGGVCSKNDFDIDVVPMQCDLIECENKEDCCEEFQAPGCDNLQENCDAGDTFSCDQYDTACVCDNIAVECNEDNRCRQVDACDDDTECGFDETCTGGKCVECSANADCSGELLCIEGRCQEGCQMNEECPLFSTCMSGQCVESGCNTDRECIASLRGNPLALDAQCVEEECVIACDNDGECGGQSVCSDGVCTFIGCENDEECRYFLDDQIRNSGGSLKAVCRE